ncbi:AAA family ATPase [Rhodoferax sp.]|uniref:ExeA family protein n=1 Tax=Rhodoferax sp. TaxID=50421 RepID=UPI00276DF7A7|nr:AAA family ATPase [Rhodoferax sp.]
MYSQHFGLTQDPFSIAPDPRYLFMSERHREALAHLLFGVAGSGGASGGRAGGTGGGFVLLTGDIGTGKTTICRCFLEQIPAGCHVAYIFNPKLTVAELLQSVCEEFHITVADTASRLPTVKDYIDALNTFLLRSHAAGESSVLIIDEAQNLSPDVLEQLRLLTNLETNERKLLQIVLIGQPELRAMLARPELEQLAQRVIARFHLDALTEPETTQYIQYRLAVAGHIGTLPFDRGALQRIYRLTRGVPRRINLLCGRALLGAWATGCQGVDRAVVDKAAAEVFGPAGAPPTVARVSSTAYALGGLGVLGGAALAGALAWTTQQQHAPLRVAAVPVRHAAATNSVPASSSLSPALMAQSPVVAIEPLLAQMPRDINVAWRELAPAWKLPASDVDPCQAGAAQQVQCYRASNLTVPQLRRLGRPGILMLQAGNDPPVYALLTGLTEQTATLQVAASQHTVRLVALGSLWRGDFSTYWRVPPGYSGRLPDGSTSPVIARLARQLSRLDGMSAPAADGGPQSLDAALRDRVRAFQRAQGLNPDGRPGPMTLMQIDSAIGSDEPRLQTEPK